MARTSLPKNLPVHIYLLMRINLPEHPRLGFLLQKKGFYLIIKGAAFAEPFIHLHVIVKLFVNQQT